MRSTYEMYPISNLTLEKFSKHINHIKEKINETFVRIVTKLISIFWNMEYFEIRNILEYGIFWNIENFGIGKFSNNIIQNISKNYLSY